MVRELVNEDDTDQSDNESGVCNDDAIVLIDGISDFNTEGNVSPGSTVSSIHQELSKKQIDLNASVVSINCWNGFKLIGDNIDKNIYRSFQRLNYGTKPLHYFHSFALLDRADFSGLSDEPPKRDIDFNTVLPTSDDIVHLRKSFVILITRYDSN